MNDEDRIVERHDDALTEAEAGWLNMDSAPRGLDDWFWGLVGRDAVYMCWHPRFEAFVSSWRVVKLAPGYTFSDGGTEDEHSPIIHHPSMWRPAELPKAIPR